METLFLMAKAVATSPSAAFLLCIVGGVLAIRWYCLVLRKLNNKRGF